MPAATTERRRGGRPPKLTSELQEKITTAIRASGYFETAAAFAGISKDTLYRWLKKGARSEFGIYRELSDAIQKALADAEMRNVMVVGKAAAGYDVEKRRTVRETNDKGQLVVSYEVTETTREFNWQAAAWWLERRFPRKWGRRDYVEVAGDPEKPIKIQQQINLFEPKQMSEMLAAWEEAKIIPAEVIALLDGPSGNGSGENGQGTDQET